MQRMGIVLATAVVSAGIARWIDAPASAEAGMGRGGALRLTSFVQAGRTDVMRNEVLEFRFTARLRKGSVDLRTLQVNEVVADGVQPATGARIVEGNVVRFTPRRTQRNYDESRLPNSTISEEDHPLGFRALAQFEVRLPAGRGERSLRGRGGRRLAARFAAQFATSALYEDPVPGPPDFAGAGGLLAFDPPPHAANGLVEDDARIVLVFSEPILEASMRLGDTVRVTRASTGEAVPGELVAHAAPPVGNVFYFEPTGGWSAAAGGQVGDVVVALTTGITDLAGNALRRPFGGP